MTERTPYSDEWLARMETDPVLMRQYFWSAGMNARREARRLREASRDYRQMSPMDGADAAIWAKTLDGVADAVLNNIEAVVASCIEQEPDHD